MSGPTKSRQELAHAIRNAETAATEVMKAREAVEDVRGRLRQAQLEADRAGVAFEQTRTGTSADGELLERGAVRLARDRLADAEDEIEALRGALKRLEKSIEAQQSAELFARERVKSAVAAVISCEALDRLIEQTEAIEAKRLAMRAVLREVWRIAEPEEVRRIEMCLAEKGPAPGWQNAPSKLPDEVIAWRAVLDALWTDPSAPLPD